MCKGVFEPICYDKVGSCEFEPEFCNVTPCHRVRSLSRTKLQIVIKGRSVSVLASVMAALYTMKQMMARKAEKALKEILDKADNNYNGKVELKDFTQILEANGVEVGRGTQIGGKVYILFMFARNLILPQDKLEKFRPKPIL